MEKELDINEVAKLMEENEIANLEGLRKVIKDYDSLCEDVIQLTCVLALLNSFIDEKGMGEEAKRFVKKCMEEQFGTSSGGEGMI